MFNLFEQAIYASYQFNFASDMVVKWSHAGTTLTLIEMHWYRNIQSSFHLLVEETNSTSQPVSLGINQGWADIQDAIKALMPPPELLQLILAKNPEIENLVLTHSPNTFALSLKNFITPPVPLVQAATPKKCQLPNCLNPSKWFKRRKSL